MASTRSTPASAFAEALAQAYNKKEAIERLCQQASIPLEYVNLGLAPIDTWISLCKDTRMSPAALQKLLGAALADKSKSAFHASLQQTAAQLFSLPASAAPLKADPHRFLCCDRAETWERLMGSASDPRLHFMLLCCTQTDGHAYLFRRIHRYRAELNAQTLGLRPEIYDLKPADFALMLRDTTHLGLDNPKWEEVLNACPEAGLIELLAEMTTEKPLVLLYPAAHPERHIPWLLEHNRTVLPAQYERIAAARRSGAGAGILIIQPIVWEPRPWERWVKRFTADAATHDLLAPLLELSSTQSLIHLCHLEAIGEHQLRSFFQRIFAGDPQRIEQRFARIEPLIENNAGAQDIFKELERIWIESQGPS